MKIRKSNLSQTDDYTFKQSDPQKVTAVGSDKDLDHQSPSGFLSNCKFCHNMEKLSTGFSTDKRIALLSPSTEFFWCRSVETILEVHIFLEKLF